MTGNTTSRTRQWFALERVTFMPAHALAFVAFIITIFYLRSTTPFSFSEAAKVIAVALVSVVPLGGLIVYLALPNLNSLSLRAALVGICGYASSVILGFLLGAVGFLKLYLPLCVVALVLWLALLYFRMGRRSLAPGVVLARLKGLWQVPSPWILASISLLSVFAVTPLLAPLVQVTSNLYYDYSFVDMHFHLTHTFMMLHSAPMSTWPDLAGTKPLIYPDYHNFWMAQLAAWSGTGVTNIFYLYAPIFMIFLDTLLLYAFGRAVTGSPYGGFLAAALGYLIVMPNPYEPNFFLRNVATPKWFFVRTHFLEFASAPGYGVGWQLLTGVALSVWLAASTSSSRIRTGALIIASIVLVAEVRIRPHFFIVMAPPYFLFLGWLGLKWRDWRLALPGVVLALLFGAVYLESTSSAYDNTTLGLALAYGWEGTLLSKDYIPAFFAPLMNALPPILVPITAICIYIITRLMGAMYVLILLFGVVGVLRRKWRLNFADYYLLAVLVCTILGASFIVYPQWQAAGGDWGGQLLHIVERITLLLAIVPSVELVRRIFRSSNWLSTHVNESGLCGLAMFSLISLRGANAALYQESDRAYPMSATELGVYRWISGNTSPSAIFAANPAHIVNAAGDTILNTNFVSAMTLRPLYLQRAVDWNKTEDDKREMILNELFTTSSPTQVQNILATTNIDYVLVYPDTQPVTDFSCCMKLVQGATPLVYQVIPKTP